MGDVWVFMLARLLTRQFWFLVIAGFFGALAMWVRSRIRDDIFREAAGLVGKKY
jgi:hypothetical protein